MVPTCTFFVQGDQERELGLPVSLLCDRNRVEVPKSQLTFLEYVVKPMFEVLAGLAPNTASKALSYVEEGMKHWNKQLTSAPAKSQ